MELVVVAAKVHNVNQKAPKRKKNGTENRDAAAGRLTSSLKLKKVRRRVSMKIYAIYTFFCSFLFPLPTKHILHIQ